MIKITVKENGLATIQDQLDEQGISTTPIKAKRVLLNFYTNEQESEFFKKTQEDSLMFNLYDYGVIDNEDTPVKVSRYKTTGEYRCVITILE